MAVDTNSISMAAATPIEPTRPQHSAMRLAWVTIVMGLVYFLAAVDRNILNILLDPIKASIGATDTQMGFLTGLAFTLVMVTCGLPLARLADRINRRNLLAASVAVWSLMTALSGLAGNYVQLLLGRVGVAAGEATHQPVSMSMVGDFFRPENVGARIAVIMIGSTLGYAVGSIAAGVLNDLYDWHVAMLAVGAPGLVVAAVIFMTIPEPPRGVYDSGVDKATVSFAGAVRRLLAIRSWPTLLAGLIFLSLNQGAFVTWIPSLFRRVHHMSTTEASMASALLFSLGPIVSHAATGLLTDRLARRGAQWRMYAASAMVAMSAPTLAFGISASDATAAIALIGLYTLTSAGVNTVTQAAILAVTPASIRATVFSINLFITGILGGLGGVIVGRLNDTVFKAEGQAALHHSLLVLPVSLALCAVMFLVASRQMGRDVARLGDAGGAGAG
jgi:MFS family permease